MSVHVHLLQAIIVVIFYRLPVIETIVLRCECIALSKHSAYMDEAAAFLLRLHLVTSEKWIGCGLLVGCYCWAYKEEVLEKAEREIRREFS